MKTEMFEDALKIYFANILMFVFLADLDTLFKIIFSIATIIFTVTKTVEVIEEIKRKRKKDKDGTLE